MYRKSTTCFGKASGEPLTEYDTEADADAGARHAQALHGCELVPYRCDRCDRWHLCPADRHTPATRCFSCSGSDGRPKARYESRSAAQKRADILYRERGVSLRVYQCPTGRGWHLTKKPW